MGCCRICKDQRDMRDTAKHAQKNGGKGDIYTVDVDYIVPDFVRRCWRSMEQNRKPPYFL